jgi:hypothetical protein
MLQTSLASRQCCLNCQIFVLDGIKILGVPFGSQQFVSRELVKIVAKIEADVPKIAPLRDGLMHFNDEDL